MAQRRATKSGYLYVLVHPSDPDLYKIGVTILHPEKRLAQHNGQLDKYAGRIVKETGQKWELKTHIAVRDPYWAERAFWGATPFPDFPFHRGVEIEKMDWPMVQKGLDAAAKAGTRPPPELEAVPDYVYANDAWMNKRLEGRGITLVGHVRSKRGKSNFRCSNGHEWRTVPYDVAEGAGCPECGTGKKDPEELRQEIRPSTICLLTHPDRPGVVRIEQTYRTLEQCWNDNVWGEWLVHRYRNVEESQLAESLIWELLGQPRPKDHKPIRIDLKRAEQAFRDLIPRMQEEMALPEMRKQGVVTRPEATALARTFMEKQSDAHLYLLDSSSVTNEGEMWLVVFGDTSHSARHLPVGAVAVTKHGGVVRRVRLRS